MLKVKHLHRMFAIGAALTAVMGSTGGAAAEVYPSRPITIVVPYAAGGSTDIIGRISMDPSEAAGILAASAIASSRSLHCIRK